MRFYLATVFHHVDTKMEDVAGTHLREPRNPFFETIIVVKVKVTLVKIIMRKTKTSLGGLSSLPLLNLWLFTKVPLLDFVSCTQISLKFGNISA